MSDEGGGGAAAARADPPDAAQASGPRLRLQRVAILGLGEAGSAIAADLVGVGVEVHGYDPGGVATPTGVVRHRHADAAVRGDGIGAVLAITPADRARTALDEVVDALPAAAIYADLSTSSPALKRELATAAARHGIGFVDVALMAPATRGLRTPALASGPLAGTFAALMQPLGMPIEAAGREPGLAATRKLLRSIVMKGLAQLVMESLEAAEAAGLATETWDNLLAQEITIDEALLQRLVAGTERHAARRVHELEATVDLLHELGVDPTMSRATLARLRQMASHPQT